MKALSALSAFAALAMSAAIIPASAQTRPPVTLQKPAPTIYRPAVQPPAGLRPSLNPTFKPTTPGFATQRPGGIGIATNGGRLVTDNGAGLMNNRNNLVSDRGGAFAPR